MEGPIQPSTSYQTIIQEAEQELRLVKKRIYSIGTFKLILFAAGVTGVIYLWPLNWLQVVMSVAIPVILFLYLIKRHNRLFYQKDYLEKKIEINQQELEALKNNIGSFDAGEEFVNPSHLYSFDLDIFGEHSLFQCINRTSTEPGRKRLAEWLNAHLENKEEIEQRQEAVKELTSKLNLRQDYRILGLLHKGKKADEEELKNWASSPSHYRKQPIARILPLLVAIINVVVIGLALTQIVPYSVAGTVFVGFATYSFLFSKNITRMQSIYGKKMQILATYAQLIRIIEEQELQSPALKEIQSLVKDNQKAASQAMRDLTKLMNALDQRNNIMMLILLNGLFFWELHQFMKIEAWKEQYASKLPDWLTAIGKLDAYSSLATFAYNHSSYSYPEIIAHPFSLQAESMGHPLMDSSQCVCNDIDIPQQPFFIIITGANMAGKSTYLRTVGINYLLACIGAPVWGKQMKLHPSRLVTSLRTSDSLTDNESYFFAELKRLKLIIDKLNNGEKLFIILDEILKGTNSVDKQKGSIALIKQFMLLKANGIIATHDLMLGSLTELFPTDIQNYCFEADITNNELTFSYRMKSGIAQNMNACFLMKKMGIAVIDD